MPLIGAAAARLYDDHVDAVHALITRRVGPDASPAIVAEAFEHALRSWERFDPDLGTERLFLFGAAVAVLRRHDDTEREHLRSISVRSDVTASATVEDPLVTGQRSRAPRIVRHEANDDLVGAAGSEDALPGSDLMVAIADLAPDDRDIVLLSLWESCPQSAIAQTLDLSVSTVRSALGRIRRELKAAISPAKGRS